LEDEASGSAKNALMLDKIIGAFKKLAEISGGRLRLKFRLAAKIKEDNLALLERYPIPEIQSSAQFLI